MSASTPTTLRELWLRRLRASWAWQRLALVRAVVRGAIDDEIAVHAAAIAHFGLLSLVPVTFLAAWLLGSIMVADDAKQQVLHLLSEALPYPEAIAEVTHRMVTDRGSMGLVGLVALLWLASRGFIALQRALDSVLSIRHHTPRRSILGIGLTSLIMMLALGVFAYASQLASSVVTPYLMAHAYWLSASGVFRQQLVATASVLISSSLSVVFMYLLYRWAPSARVRRRSAAIGALVAGLLWEASKVGFTIWYSRYARIDRFYGAMGGLVLVVTWSYLSAFILLLGAEVTAAHARLVLHRPATEDAREALPERTASVPATSLEQPPDPARPGEPMP